MFDHILVPINRAGWPFITIAAGVAVVLGFIWTPLFWIGLLLTLFCVYFFRDPNRFVPQRHGLVVSPADGHVTSVGPASLPRELSKAEGSPDAKVMRVSIFLSVFDVHVNRVPLAGKILESHYVPGKFVNAAFDKASDENERQIILMQSDDGRELVFVQIAGLIARRIICNLKEGQTVETGERFGLIRFGSRLDVYLPEGTMPLVTEGQRMVGGETVIADLESQEGARQGISR